MFYRIYTEIVVLKYRFYVVVEPKTRVKNTKDKGKLDTQLVCPKTFLQFYNINKWSSIIIVLYY